MKITRRNFLKIFSLAALGALLSQLFCVPSWALPKQKFNGRPRKNIKGDHDLVVAKGEDPAQLVFKAVEAMGGMSRFVKPGAVVVVKPNMAWDRTPEYAANTSPEVAAAVVELCYAAGAKRVNVFDIPCNSAERVHANSGIPKACEAKGAKVYYTDNWNFVKSRYGQESPMEGWPIYRDAIECDTFINVPVLKHHGYTRLTLGMKNLMGVCGGSRGLIHIDIAKKLVDLSGFINADLTIIDAYRVLERHGPSGGNLDDVKLYKSVIVGTDPVLTDIYAAKLVDVDPNAVSYIAEAIDRGMGSLDTSKADIFNISV